MNARARFSQLATAYSLLVGAFGLGLLLATSTNAWSGAPASLILFFLGLSFLIKLMGFRVAADVTHSLGTTVDVTALLVLGWPLAGWTAGLSSLLFSATDLHLRHASRGELWETACFNGGLKALLAMVCGSFYASLGGDFAPTELGLPVLARALLFFGAWVVLDHAGWAIREWLQRGVSGLASWLRNVLVASVLVELLPLPLSLLIAVIFGALGLTAFLLAAAVLTAMAAVIGRLADARFTLRERVQELTALNRMGQAVLHAHLDVEAICELIYQQASRIVDTSTFQLGLFEGDAYNLKVWVREGQRQPPTLFPSGGRDGIIGWMRATRRHLLVRDFAAEAATLPATPSYASPRPPRSALFVPLVAEDAVIGALALQSFRPAAFTNDHLRLLTNIANQAAAAIENAQLQMLAVEKERMEHELALASQIQSSLLPACCPSIPGYELAAEWRSARQVSGDFYDFFALPDGKWGILIGDVSDKGVPAALFMALSRSLIRSGVIGAVSPAGGLQRANEWILKDTTSGLFVTVFYAVLDVASHQLTYVNCGHNPPLLLREGSGDAEWLSTQGIALGMMEGITLEERTLGLGSHDLLLLYTDGITEAMNSAQEFFGTDRLLAAARDAMAERPAGSPDQAVAAVLSSLSAFVGDAPPADDITLVALQRTS
ncbi:MAG: SpoIIE family protein phosphatase [Chloroflexota bacterium]|nr:SpoIIE family protein phosphatase [Chloroflexota bacterium]